MTKSNLRDEYESIWVRRNDTKLKLKALSAGLEYRSMMDFLEDLSEVSVEKLKELLKK